MADNAQGTALVTGASTGIGAVYADRLARRGYDLILVARNRQQLEALAERLAGESGRAVQVTPADLTDPGDLARVETVLSTDTRITMLVNNAGMAMNGSLAVADPDRLENMIRLNVLAPTRLARAVLPNFLAQGRGTLINLSSAAALAPERLNATYSGTKAFLLTWSIKLQKETADKGVRVQVVLPGATRTEIWERAGQDIARLPPEIVMETDRMVDAALAGLDQGELVTIPSLPDPADWEAFEAARHRLLPNLSRNAPAARYGVDRAAH